MVSLWRCDGVVMKSLLYGFLVVLLLTSSLLKAGEHISICNGQMFGANWGLQHKLFITETLSEVGYSVDFFDVPYVRAQRMFERRLCQLLVGPGPLDTERYIKVAKPVAYLSLWLLGDTADKSELEISSLPSLLAVDDIIAYPRSEQIQAELERHFKPELLMQVHTVEQGLTLLKLGRVDYFVLPEVGSTSLDDYQAYLDNLFFVDEIARWPMYWWFHKDMSDKVGIIEHSLEQTCPKPQWRFNFGLGF